MSREKIYVKVKHTEENNNFFAFGCTGYGWVYKDELETSNYITVQCEDNYEGNRGWSTDISNIEICNIQKECPYNI